MDLHYLAWVFKQTLVVTLLYIITCLVIWLLLGGHGGGAALVISIATWGMLFFVHVKDWRMDQRYHKAHRDRSLSHEHDQKG